MTISLSDLIWLRLLLNLYILSAPAKWVAKLKAPRVGHVERRFSRWMGTESPHLFPSILYGVGVPVDV